MRRRKKKEKKKKKPAPSAILSSVGALMTGKGEGVTKTSFTFALKKGPCPVTTSVA